MDELASLKNDLNLGVVVLEQKNRKLRKDLGTFINISKEKLEASIEGMVFLNQKAMELTGKGMFDAHTNLVHEEGVGLEVNSIDLATSLSVRTRRKTKKGKKDPTQDVEEIMDMHDRLTARDITAAKVLKNLL